MSVDGAPLPYVAPVGGWGLAPCAAHTPAGCCGRTQGAAAQTERPLLTFFGCMAQVAPAVGAEAEVRYDKKKSFFDSISCESTSGETPYNR